MTRGKIYAAYHKESREHTWALYPRLRSLEAEENTEIDLTKKTVKLFQPGTFVVYLETLEQEDTIHKLLVGDLVGWVERVVFEEVPEDGHRTEER